MNILPRSKFSFSLTILLFNTAIETQYIYKRESTFNDIEELFECEVKGTGNECSRDSLYSFFNAISYILRSNVAAVLFIFLIDFKSLKKRICPQPSALSLPNTSARSY